MISARIHRSRAIRSLFLVSLFAIVLGASAAVPAFAQASGTWSNTGSMNSVRIYHTATPFPNGEVLAAGGVNPTEGYLISAELYNPATGKWTFTGSMQTALEGHVATLLQNGQVLVTGGINANGLVASAELYNPATGTFTATGRMTTGRYGQSATLLQNGRVLVAGGNTAELYNPATGRWTATGNMPSYGAAATFTVVSSSEITTKVPAGATTGDVKVVTPSGTLSSNVSFRVP